MSKDPTTITYNIIQNFIIVDSAEEVKLIKPFEMPLKNLGKTKILLNSKNEVQSIETIFKDEREQTFSSPLLPDKDLTSITPKENTKLKIDVSNSKEGKVKIGAQDSTVEFKPKEDPTKSKKLVFTIKNGEIIVTEDDGSYKVEGKNVLTSFNSLLYKQFLNNAKSIEATPEEGFSEIKFDKKGSFISEFQKFTIEGLELEDFNKIGNKYVS